MIVLTVEGVQYVSRCVFRKYYVNLHFLKFWSKTWGGGGNTYQHSPMIYISDGNLNNKFQYK